MSADTEEVTPPPDVTLGKKKQSKVQSSASCSLLCFPTCWSHSFPLFRQHWPGSSRSLWSSLNVESPERLSASMRRNNCMEKWINFRVPGPEPVFLPEPDFTADISSGGMEKRLLRFKPEPIPQFDTHRSNESMKPPLPFKQQQNQERNFWLGFVRLVKRISSR